MSGNKFADESHKKKNIEFSSSKQLAHDTLECTRDTIDSIRQMWGEKNNPIGQGGYYKLKVALDKG